MTVLYRTDPSKNMRRFYRMHLQCDLFGCWLLTREWGRIGRRGQLKAESFISKDEAFDALRKQLEIKRKRGYVDSESVGASTSFVPFPTEADECRIGISPRLGDPASPFLL